MNGCAVFRMFIAVTRGKFVSGTLSTKSFLNELCAGKCSLFIKLGDKARLTPQMESPMHLKHPTRPTQLYYSPKISCRGWPVYLTYPTIDAEPIGFCRKDQFRPNTHYGANSNMIEKKLVMP